MATLAQRSGVSERQVQRAVGKLEKAKFLKRVKRRSSGIIASNAYDLSPLIEILETVAQAFPNAYPRRQLGKRTKPVSSSPITKEDEEALDAMLENLLGEEDLSSPEPTKDSSV